RRQLTGEKTPLEKARPDLSPQTYHLVDKCLRQQTWSRYKKIEDLIGAIDEAIRVEKLHVGGNGDAAVEQSLRRPRTQVVLLPAILLVLCVAGMALLGVWLRGGQASEPDPTFRAAISDGPPITTSPTAEPTATSTGTAEPTAVAAAGEIQTLAPSPDSQIDLGTTLVFRWSWPDDLGANQQFAVYVRSEVDPWSQVGIISEQADGGTYWLEAQPTSFDGQAGDYWWHVALENTETDAKVAESKEQPFKLAEASTTATPAEPTTPDVTETPTVTHTPTPRPEVRVIVSSGSLRTGPGTNYTILHFLFEGEVVLVIGKDPRNEWYNVRLPDGTLGWLAASVSEPVNAMAMTAVPVAATIPPSPTPTNTPTPTPTNTPTITPTVTGTPPPPPPPSNNGGNTPAPTETPLPTLTPPPPSSPTPTPPA
ncbi:MAG TPA: SH3 domain-containing protein, partial [Anaerolineae bacterium]